MKRIASIYINQRIQLVRSSLAMLSFLLLFVAPVMATHIVGGAISYRCLGNDQYEITVRVYRDCFNAAPGADFDDPASIGIFDRAGLLVADVRVPFVSEDTLANIPSECLVIPGNVCVNTTTYVTTVELPFREGGYQLVYQRCCRNETIQNLVNPLETGATYDIWLTEESMLTCNSSPVFKEWPPIFICVNDELNFDHSAIDADGDSLVYKLIAPLQGGTFAEPMPQPPNPPPYDDVLLIEPTYSVDNFLGFGEPLKVDQDNGLMTVTPSILGQFVVGVSVEEYDRETGTLLSVSRRDFQYNVIQCVPFEAVFEAPDAVCDEFTVQFDNQTEGASDFLWNFSSADTAFTSSERSPEITFPDTGLYQVELIVDPGYVRESCFAKAIFVQTNSLTADFRIDVLACTDSSYLFLTDRSVDSVSAPVDWEWIISPEGMEPFTVNGQFPIVPVPKNSRGMIQLNVTSENNCMSSSTMSYEAPGIDLRTYLQDTIYACIGDQINLNPLTPPDVQLDYNWSGPGISDAALINPMLEVQAGTTVYQVTISGSENSCFIEAEIVVIGGERPALDFTVVTNCDGLSYRFEDLSTNATSIEWIIGDLSAPLLISQEASFDFTFPTEGSYPVYLIGVAGCTDTLLRNIEIQNNDLDVGIDVRYTDCEADQIDVQLMAQTATTDSIISYDWRLSDGKTSTAPNPVFSFGESQALTASLVVETARGCVDSVEQELQINLITDVLARLPDTVALCDGVPTALFPENDDKYTYEWSPAEGLDDPNSSNPTFLQPGTFNVVISIPGSASCRVETQVVSFLPEAINLDITVSELPDDFDASEDGAGNGSILGGVDLESLEEVPVLDGKVTSCSSALLLTANTEPEVSVNWYLNGEEVSVDSIYYLAQVTGENIYTAIATDRFDCTDTSTLVIDLRGVDVALPDQVAVCDGEPILVTAENTHPDDDLTYTWSPADWVVAGQGTPNVNLDAPIGINFAYVEATNQFGCAAIDSVEIVVVDPNHDLKFEVTSLCDSVTVRFTNQSENAFGYLWSFGDLENPDATSTEESPIYTYPEPGTYTALLTLQYDVSCRDTFELTFNTVLLPPDLGLELNLPDTLFTGGNSITIETIVDAETYTWTNSSGQVIGTKPGITVNPECEEIFYLEVTDEFGCVYRDTVVVINEIIDVVLTPPSPVAICDGDEVQLMVENLKDCDTLSYSWGPDSLLVSSGNTANPTFQFNEAGNYQATGIVTNQYGTVDTIVVDFNVGNLDGLGLMSPLTGCVGDAFDLFPGADSTLDYTWAPADLLNDPNALNPRTIPLDRDTTFFVTVSLPGTTCMIEDTVVVDVNEDIILDITADPGLMVCPQTTVTLEAELEEGATIAWLDADGNLLGAADTLDVDVINEPIEITAVARDTNGCEQRQTITLTPEDLDIGLDSPVEACAEIPTPINPGGNVEYNYEWSPAAGLDDPFSPNPIYDASMDQTFGVTVTDPVTGCIVMDSVEVLIIDHPSITVITNDTMICEPTSLTLMVETDQPTTLEWFADAEMTMSLGTGTSIEVMPGEGLNEYFVKTGDEICIDNRDVDTVRVEIVDFSAVSPDTLLEICKGQETQLNPNGDGRFSYEWSPTEGLDDPLSPNPLFDGAMDQDFTVTITSPDGMCMVERIQKVRLLDPVNLDAGTDTILCREGNFTLEAMHEGGQNVMWAADRDFTVSVSNGDSYEIELEDGGRYYYVKAENSLGCTELDSIFIGSGLIDAMLPEEVLVCDAAEGAMLLVSNNKPDQELTYLWMPEDKFESDPMVGPMATLEPGADGLVMLILENQFGCSAELNTRVIVDDVGSARIEASDTVVQVGNPVELSVVDCEDCQYEWSPTETIDNPNASMVTARPLETTEYFVTVTKGDCETVLSITIMTEGGLCTTENIFVPRAFTPNGDNQNDVLFVRSNVIDEMHFIIYNRWGQEVFDTRDINEGWDGTFRGNELPPDVYGYYLQARCIDGSELTLQGNVTLLR